MATCGLKPMAKTAVGTLSGEQAFIHPLTSERVLATAGLTVLPWRFAVAVDL